MKRTRCPATKDGGVAGQQQKKSRRETLRQQANMSDGRWSWKRGRCPHVKPRMTSSRNPHRAISEWALHTNHTAHASSCAARGASEHTTNQANVHACRAGYHDRAGYHHR